MTSREQVMELAERVYRAVEQVTEGTPTKDEIQSVLGPLWKEAGEAISFSNSEGVRLHINGLREMLLAILKEADW
jgi:hypothetical protein